MKKTTKVMTAVVLTFGIVGGAAAFGVKQFAKDERRAEWALSYITDELSLDQVQQEALTALKNQMLAAHQELDESMDSGEESFKALVTADTFDQVQAMELINSKTAYINDIAPDMLAALGGFLDTLSADQKSELLDLVEDRKGWRKGRRDRDFDFL